MAAAGASVNALTGRRRLYAFEILYSGIIRFKYKNIQVFFGPMLEIMRFEGKRGLSCTRVAAATDGSAWKKRDPRMRFEKK